MSSPTGPKPSVAINIHENKPSRSLVDDSGMPERKVSESANYMFFSPARTYPQQVVIPIARSRASKCCSCVVVVVLMVVSGIAGYAIKSMNCS